MYLVALLLAASTALAQSSNPARDEEARGLFEAGRSAFDDGRYEDALNHFNRSYQVGHRAEILFNIGLCNERLDRKEEALAAYRGYLDAQPTAANVGDVRARIAALDRPESAEPEPEPDTSLDVSETTNYPAPEPEPPGRLWTWIVGGAGVALGVVGAVMWGTAQADYDSFSARCQLEGCTNADVDAQSGINTRAMIGNIFVPLGIAALAGGVVLFFVEGNSGERAVEAGIGPGSLTVRGRF